jgi:hypothetical protein
MILNGSRRMGFMVLLIAGGAIPIRAQSTTQAVTFSISAINQIAFVGAPSLTVTAAVPGAGPSSVTDATATWAVTTNQSGAKITANIPTAMPPGLTLSSDLAPPTGASSAGFQALSTVAVDLVTGITKVAQGLMVVTYRLDATPAAGVVSAGSRIVTYTITGGT